MDNGVKSTVGGPVQVNSGTYLQRPADQELLKACQAGKFAYILASRQIGKSSLMNQTAEFLREESFETAVIDLNGVGQYTDAEKWFYTLIDLLTQRLKLKVDLEEWWKTRTGLTLARRFLQFLREIVLDEIKKPVVIFIDEIDVTLGLDFTDDFFAAIRTVYSNRTQDPLFRRLSFVLLGVATPSQLIEDNNRTPFNIGQRIELRDFPKDSFVPFIRAIENSFPKYGSRYFDEIYAWTNGHPYLTQKLCNEVQKWTGSENETLVDHLVQQLFISPETHDDDNIQFVRDRVSRDEYAQALLRSYRKVLQDQKPVLDDKKSPVISRMKLFGLTIVEDHKLKVRNKLYAHLFDEGWIDQMLEVTGLGVPPQYRILQRLGEGGLFRVYLAETKDTGKKLVALKVLDLKDKPEAQWDKWRNRFTHEITRIKQIEHPHIAPTLNFGATDEHTLFLVLPYMSTGTLRTLMADTPLTKDQGISIIKQIGQALDTAHQQNIIHRDVKPGNILLEAIQEEWQAVLSDFCMVDLLSVNNLLSHVKNNDLRETAHYMAPEQWYAEPVSPATDIYALAMTFFEIITGQRPFKDSSIDELEHKQKTVNLPPLSRISPEIDPAFDDVLRKATAKNPVDRYQTVPEFISALEIANSQTDMNRQVKANELIAVIKSYMDLEVFSPDVALKMVQDVYELRPNFLAALNLEGRIKLAQKDLQGALAALEQAFEQDQDPRSEISERYLNVLEQLAETAWDMQDEEKAKEYSARIMDILGGDYYEDSALQKKWGHLGNSLIGQYKREGDKVYADANSETIAISDALPLLKELIGLLENLRAKEESRILTDKLRHLKVRDQENIIEIEKAAINDTLKSDQNVDFTDETLFERFSRIDAAYIELIGIDSENTQWPKSKQQGQNEQAKVRRRFADKTRNDYQVAIRHYRAILELSQNIYPPEFLESRIQELERDADYAGKYRTITDAMDSGDHKHALEKLTKDFITTGNYEYNEAARLLWELVYAQKHGGKWPPERIIEPLVAAFVGQMEERIGHITAILRAYIDLPEKTKSYAEYLRNYEVEIREIELAHNQLEDVPKDEHFLARLADLKTQIQKNQNVLSQIDGLILKSKIEAWQQQVESIQEKLKTEYVLEVDANALLVGHQALRNLEQNQDLKTLTDLDEMNQVIRPSLDSLNVHLQKRAVGSLSWRVEQISNNLEETAEELKQSRKKEGDLRKAFNELQKDGLVAKSKLEDAQRQIEQLFAENEDLLKKNETMIDASAELDRTIAESHQIKLEAIKKEKRHSQLLRYYQVNQFLIFAFIFVAAVSGFFLTSSEGVLAARIINLILLISGVGSYIRLYVLPPQLDKPN